MFDIKKNNKINIKIKIFIFSKTKYICIYVININKYIKKL